MSETNWPRTRAAWQRLTDELSYAWSDWLGIVTGAIGFVVALILALIS